MTREQENRRLALWVAPDMIPCKFSGCDHTDCWETIDFWRDESANAMLLRALPQKAGVSIIIRIDPSGYSLVEGLGLTVAVSGPDPMSAICAASLKLIEAEGR